MAEQLRGGVYLHGFEVSGAYHAGSDWRRFTLDQPTEVYVQLAVRPTWTGEATLTPVILEGDWTAT